MTTTNRRDNGSFEVRLERFATVTFALYDDAPIACQGDDDHTKIQVIRRQMKVSGDLYGDALAASMNLAQIHGLPVQVWDIVHDESL